MRHGITHHIVTYGQAVFPRPRRMSGERLAIARRELGIARPSSRTWASLLHMVPKKDPACGDYRALNANTLLDLPHFTANLSGC